jgi:hypothetical protein
MAKQIIVQLTRSNSGGVVAVEIETAGFQGQECTAPTAALEAALGGVVGNREWKPEASVPAVLSSSATTANHQQLRI